LTTSTPTPTDGKEQIFLRVDRSLYDMISNAADLDDRSMASWMRIAAKEKLRRLGLMDGQVPVDEPPDKFHPETK
jgi:hypothetical protein